MNFCGFTPTTAHITLNSDGSVTAGQGDNDFNANLLSAGHIGGWPGSYVGTAFGGGAYIQAEVKFNAESYDGITTGWPAFWTYALEPELGVTQWPGQASGYQHYFEGDIFEYFQGQWGGPLDSYSATSIDHYGINAAGNHSISTPYTVPQADFLSYNTIAMLWVPATSTTDGYIKYYWDGHLVSSTSYSQLTSSDAPPPSASKPWTFGIIDQDHLVLEMGSNNIYPITVDNVQVWQSRTTSNDVTVSPKDTVVDAPSSAQITDSRGGIWSINSSDYLVWNGITQDTAYKYNIMFWNGTNFYVHCTTSGHVCWVLVNLSTGGGTVISGNPPGYP